jgi:hypothetical protein
MISRKTNTFPLTSLPHYTMFVLPISTCKRLENTRPVSAGFPYLNANYAPPSGVSFSRTTQNVSIERCRTSYVALRERASRFLQGGGRTGAVFLFLPIPKSVSLCKPFLCSPNLRACKPLPRRSPATRPPAFTRSTQTLLNGTKRQYAALVQFWTRLVCPLSPMTCVVPTSIYCEVLP